VIALGGRVTHEADVLRDHGVTALFSICPGPMSLKEARTGAVENLRFTARQLATLWSAARG
jgi:glycerate kinase